MGVVVILASPAASKKKTPAVDIPADVPTHGLFDDPARQPSQSSTTARSSSYVVDGFPSQRVASMPEFASSEASTRSEDYCTSAQRNR